MGCIETVITGLIVSYLNGYAHEAMTLGIGSGYGKSTALSWHVVRDYNGL